MSEPTPSRLIPHSRPTLGGPELEAVTRVLRNGHPKGGPERLALEREMAESQGFHFGFATTTGSHALHLFLRATFPQGGARVAIPSYVCRALYDIICAADCEPLLTDIAPAHFGPRLDQVEALQPDVLVLCHLFGVRLPEEAYLQAAPILVFDYAQRIETSPPSRRDLVHHAAIYSYEATKLLTAGEGGVLLLSNEGLADRLDHLRDGGYSSPERALWLPMTDLQASVARAQWRQLPEFLAVRRSIALRYREAFDRFQEYFHPSVHQDDNLFHRFLFQVPHARHFIRTSESSGVMLRRPVAPEPLHRLFGVDGDFPATDHLDQSLVSIPIYPSMTEEDIETVIRTLTRLLEEEFHS